jgi:hypothetical protein
MEEEYMKIPKFSAEESLYKSNRLYRMNGEIESKIGQVIAPAYASQYYKLTPFDRDWGFIGHECLYDCCDRIGDHCELCTCHQTCIVDKDGKATCV